MEDATILSCTKHDRYVVENTFRRAQEAATKCDSTRGHVNHILERRTPKRERRTPKRWFEDTKIAIYT